MILEIDNFLKTHNKREKYAQINLSYWEAEDHMSEQTYLFWLDDPTTFAVKGEKVVIPVSTFREKGSSEDEEVRVDFRLPFDLAWIPANQFPVRNKDKLANMPNHYDRWSVYHIWGEDDNIAVLPSEFSNAGGGITLEYNTEEKQYQVVVTPPQTKIGTNENFSLSLEGTVPGLAIGGLGFLYRKKTIVGYTEHMGKTTATLDLELHHVTNHKDALTSLQRLIEKYNSLQPTYTVDYISPKSDPNLEQEPIVIDNNHIVPQSVSISYMGEVAAKSTSNGFAYTPFDFFNFGKLRAKKFSDLQLDHITFNELQYNLHAYLH